jgi:hypothetical protein
MNLKYLYHSNTNSDMFRNKANLTTALFFSDFFLKRWLNLILL